MKNISEFKCFVKKFVVLLTCMTVSLTNFASSVMWFSESKAINSHPQQQFTQPDFPGGKQAYMQFVANNLKYPEAALMADVQGQVVLRLEIERDGTIIDVKVVKSIDPLLDAEAVRVARLMPKWNPGKQNGKPIRCRFDIPVNFKIAGTNEESDSEKVTMVIEEAPAYPGGQQALMQFLAHNVKYPKAALMAGIQGRVLLSAVIDVDGSIVDVQVVESVNPLLDAEAVRVARLMPKWTPRKQNGKPVRVRFGLPVNFRLGGNAKK